MKQFLLILLAVLLAGGCSLTGDDAPDGATGLRLLAGGQHKTISDPAANDWSPQMVYFGTNRYLYFLSDRGFTGSTYAGPGSGWISNTKAAGSVGIFRALEVEPGVFSNIQLWHTFGTGIDVAAIVMPPTNAYNAYAIIKLSETNFTNIFLYQGTGLPVEQVSTIYGSGNPTDLFPAGCMYDSGQMRVFFGRKITGTGDISCQYLQVSCYEGGTSSLNPLSGSAILSFEQTAGTNAGLDLLRGRELLGAWPANFTRPSDGKGCFGFYTSYGGILTVLLFRQYMNYTDFSLDGMGYDMFINPGQRPAIIALPLLRVTHYAGTIDRNPSYDPATGLYFSSNRDGKYNLYLVPKELLYLPEWLEMP